MRVEVPKCDSVLQARYEICVMFWQLRVPVVTWCSCRYKSRLVLWQPRAMLLNRFASHCQCSVLAATVLVALLYRGMVQASSTISPVGFEPAG